MTARAQIITWTAFCVIVFALVWTAMFGGTFEPALRWMGRNDKAAAWVQAFGSIAAILASGGVAVWLFNREAEHRREERAIADAELQLGAVRVLLTAILSMNATFGTCLKNTQAQNWTNFRTRLSLESFGVGRDLLMSINGRDLPPGLELQRGILLTSLSGGTAFIAKVREELPNQPRLDLKAIEHSLAHLAEVEEMVRGVLFE